MKLKTFLLSVVVGLTALVAEKASAFPLYLTALSGTVSSTAHYGPSEQSTTNKVKVVAVTLKQVLTVISNEISIKTFGTNAPPANSRIAYDPYTDQTYVTNQNGYFYDLKNGGVAQVSINCMATSFRRVSVNGLAENDIVHLEFWVYGTAPGVGPYSGFDFDVIGKGKLVYSVNPLTHKATMVLTDVGSGYGEYQSSYNGVTAGSLVFSGSGTPEWTEPYSVYWYNHFY